MTTDESVSHKFLSITAFNETFCPPSCVDRIRIPSQPDSHLNLDRHIMLIHLILII